MDGIELMAGAMHAAQARLDVSAANLSNLSSAGFQRRIAHATLGERGLSVSSSIDRTQGPLERTGRVFDLATVGGTLFVRDAGNVTGRLRLTPGTSVESGFLERSNVDAVHEMVDVLSAQRAFETAQKALSAIDEARAKDVNDVVRVKA